MKYQHTMGDWVTAPMNHHGSKGCAVWTDDGLIKIADCQSTTLILGAAQANARLVAAAPALLAVVRRLLEDGLSDTLAMEAMAAYRKAIQ